MSLLSLQTASSPSSPMRRQIGFVPAYEPVIPSTVNIKREETEEDGEMKDLWTGMGGNELQGDRLLMDYDMTSSSNDNGITIDEDLLMSNTNPVAPQSNASEVTSGSTKTTSESTCESSAYNSPSMNAVEKSPSSSSLKEPRPSTGAATTSESVQSTDSIAQMLEYMRACNSQDRSVPLSSSIDSAYESQSSIRSESRDGLRKKERSSSSSNRNGKSKTQRSPAHKTTRTLSHGSLGSVGGESSSSGGGAVVDDQATGGGNNSKSSNRGRLGPSAIQRMRPRSKTYTGSTTSSSTTELQNLLLRIDTESAVEATGPSGISNHSHSAGVHQQQSHQGQNSYSDRHDAWTASTSPMSSRSMVPTWSTEGGGPSPSTTNQSSMNNSLSLMEFLKRPEGAAWVEHFQKQELPPIPSTEPVVSPVPLTHQHTPQSNVSTGPATNPFFSALPAQIDVANVLGIQQSPNSALIQAFQTAFVLGLQQLGIGNQFHSTQPTTNRMDHESAQQSQPSPYYPFQWAQQGGQLQANALLSNSPGRTIQPPLPSRTNTHIDNASTSSNTGNDIVNANDGSAVLQSLLHDINQHRPNQEEFSVDDFLAFVANTMEQTSEDGNAAVEQEKEQQKRSGRDSGGKSRKISKKTFPVESPSSSLENGSKNKATTGEKKTSHNRTLSISGQLVGTHLDDVIEDIMEEGRNQESRSVARDQWQKGSGMATEVVSAMRRDSEQSQKGGEEREEEKRDSDAESRERESIQVATHSSTISPTPTKGTGEKEASKLAERRRRRRESHNAVERRRRDHINERIAELASLLPESMLLDAIAASTAGGTTPHIDLSLFTRANSSLLDVTDPLTPHERNHSDLERKAIALAPVSSSSETLALAQSKPNKGIILSKSVDYIKHLHEFCSILRSKNKELQQEMIQMKDAVMLAGVNPSLQDSAPNIDLVRPVSDGLSTSGVTPPPNLATWWAQYREKDEATEAGAKRPSSSSTVEDDESKTPD